MVIGSGSEIWVAPMIFCFCYCSWRFYLLFLLDLIMFNYVGDGKPSIGEATKVLSLTMVVNRDSKKMINVLSFFFKTICIF
ncbi:hypothetical protein JHK86_024304 [Glycine max]|nr:hypothetical protein JHK86_024304 [Glycine max]